MKKVSIIIPVYNYGHLVEETLKNLTDQSYYNWEAIIIDDGSIDETRLIVEKFKQQDKRFIYLNQKNKGVSSARNLGLKHSSGDYIQFLDGDDLLSKHKISLQVEHLELNPALDISYTKSFYFLDKNPGELFLDNGGKNVDWMHKLSGKGFNIVHSLITQNLCVISSPLLKKDILDSGVVFTEGTAYLEDWEFWLKLSFFKNSFEFFHHPKAFTKIRLHTKSVSSRYNIKMKESHLILRKKIIQLIAYSDFEESQKDFLVKLNMKCRNSELKRLICEIGLLNINELVKLQKKHTSPLTFFKNYIKAINHYRKELF
ncbi:glycosyltransferase family 2 protein [Echinicola rosea]|uniref:Glycosyltransferase 2-like domain-containing protein n=1 Tax=Echinicola rosea TaxID=1807691 RepID=A0ABQ1V6Q8_9BACT|nr:glycosyltransferase family A protein [Echinicola rosea]GGF37999.1 hypothetical protein GCM10011339_28190 [Echinicola rosea]